MTNCTNCNNEIAENYCPNCGQVAKLKRIDWHYLQHEFMHLFHLEKGFIYTLKQLLTNPGENIRTFLTQNRNKLMKPIPFLVFTSLIYALVGSFFDASEVNNSIGKITVDNSNSYVTKILNWFQGHYAYANIVVGFFIAFFIKVFFKKYNYNYFEIITMLCYVLGLNMVAMAILVVFYGTLNIIVYRILFSLFVYGYSLWAIAHFFDKTKILSYIKAFIAFFLGYFLYFTVVTIIGIGIDVILELF
jgi:Protein of unknown function (DUF3667)